MTETDSGARVAGPARDIAVAHGRSRHRVSRLLASRAVAVAGVFAAGGPVLRWYAARLSDGSDEPLGLFALAAALFFAPRQGWWEPVSVVRRLAASAFLGAYALSFGEAPPLLRATLWIGALATLVTGRPSGTTRGAAVSPLAWSGLLLLSLPWVASLQFYLGFPLRVLTTHAAALLLNLGPLHVRAEATVLHCQGERVLIDAPCSGIQMLWTLLLAAAVAACAQKLDTRATLRLFRRAASVVFVANTLRACALFAVEMSLWPSPAWAHDAIGLTLFATAVLALLWKRTPVRAEDGPETTAQEGARAPTGNAGDTGAAPENAYAPAPRGRRRILAIGAWATFTASVGAVALAPFQSRARPAAQPSAVEATFPGWESAPLPDGLTPVTLSARDLRFAEQFPGKMAAFTDGRTTWIVRWVRQPTRKLHPAVDCLRAGGYLVAPGAAQQDASGGLWSGALAERGEERLQVRERITAADGGAAWTDVSAWFWAACLGRTTGPWWSVTRLSRSLTDKG